MSAAAASRPALEVPRGSPYGDCAVCRWVAPPWQCAHPLYPAGAAVRQARAGPGWPYVREAGASDPEGSVPAAGRLDLSRPYSEGGACGPAGRLFEARARASE